MKEQGRQEEAEKSTIKKGILEDVGPLLLVLVLLLDPVLAELGRQVDGVLAVPALPLQAELVPPKPERGCPADRGRGRRSRQHGGASAALMVMLLLMLILVLLLLL